MGLLSDAIAALQAISTFSPRNRDNFPNLDDPGVISARKALGGNLEPIPEIRLRWYPPDIEKAQRAARNGDLTLIGQISESMKLDGTYRGLLDARTSVASFPKRFYGDAEIIKELQSKNNSDRDVYEEMIPETEAKLMIADGDICGVAIGEMVPVVGRNFPVLIRRYPQNLFYLQNRNQWYYRSWVGFIPIYPGIPDENGNSWVLHIPGGRLAPWNNGLWNTCGRSYINKTQCLFARQAYEMKHAHPLRVLFAAIQATQEEREGTMAGAIRWALNSIAMLQPGWDVKLVETNGQGVKVYQDSIKTYNEEMATAICGSSVMLTGTVGFANMNPFETVNRNILRGSSRGWDHTVNTQILPAQIASKWGVERLRNATTVETDINKPADRAVEAQILASLSGGISGMVDAIAKAQVAMGSGNGAAVALALTELLMRFGVPTVPTSVIPALPAGPEPSASASGKESTPSGEGKE